MSLIRIVTGNAKRHPDKTAIYFADQSLTYSQLIDQVSAIAIGMQKIGVGPGSHLTVLLNNSVEFAVVMLAAAKLGATIVPMATSLNSDALDVGIKATDCEFLIGWHAIVAGHLEAMQTQFPIARDHILVVGGELPGCPSYTKLLTDNSGQNSFELADINEDADFILTMTSGSTSAPKPIVFTQATKINRSYAARDMYELTEDDIILAATPMYHSLAQRLVLLPLLLGATSVIMAGFSPKAWLGAVEKYAVTFSIAVSSQLEMIVENLKGNETRLSSLKTIVSSSALLKIDIKSKLIEAMNCDFHECYGASEVGIVSNLSPADSRDKRESVGTAGNNVTIRIVNKSGADVALGEIGEICCRTPLLFFRYYKNPEETQRAVVDGYFHTGDLGYLDEDGFLYFSGRAKELIITGGINVYPKDVEEVLSGHDLVEECAVIGVEDKQFGEAVVAVIKLTASAEPDERSLRRHCFKQLADFQQPLAYYFIDELPKSSMGKIMKHKLVDQLKGKDTTEYLRTVLQRN